MKKIAVLAWLAILCTAVAAIFWYNEWVYKIPTPVPAGYENVENGKKVDLPASLEIHSRPLLIHFFNPGCPCSRFNMAHFRALEKEFRDKVSFAIVVMSEETHTEKEIQEKFDVNIPVLFDTAMAAGLGVYSTPQAVIVDTTQRLYYRGNYNRTRYCTDKKTEYARLALNSLLQNDTVVFNEFALTAYGCQLPKCTK